MNDLERLITQDGVAPERIVLGTPLVIIAERCLEYEAALLREHGATPDEVHEHLQRKQDELTEWRRRTLAEARK